MKGIIFGMQGWAGGLVLVEVFGSPQETWTIPHDLDRATLTDIGQGLVDWINDAARGWAPLGAPATFTLVETSDGRLGLDVTGTYEELDPFNVATAAWTGTINTHTVGARGTLAVDVDSYGWGRRDESDGAISGSGASWVQGATAHAHRRPSVSWTMTPAQAFDLARGLQYLDQSSPTALVWHPVTSSWRSVTVGKITWRPDQVDLVEVSLEVLG